MKQSQRQQNAQSVFTNQNKERIQNDMSLKQYFMQYYLNDFYKLIQPSARSYIISIISLLFSDKTIEYVKENDQLMYAIQQVFSQFKGWNLLTTVFNLYRPWEYIIVFQTTLNCSIFIIFFISLLSNIYYRNYITFSSDQHHSKVGLAIKAFEAFVSYMISVYTLIFHMPFQHSNFKQIFDKGDSKEIYMTLAMINIASTIIIGLVTVLYDFSYSYKPKDYLAKEESFIGIINFLLESVICFLCQAEASWYIYMLFILIHLNLVYYIIYLPYYKKSISKTHFQLILIQSLVWFLNIFFQIRSVKENLNQGTIVISSFPLIYKIAQYFYDQKVSETLKNLNQQNVKLKNIELYCRNLASLVDLDQYQYMKEAQGMTFETVYVYHIENCQEKECFCNDYKVTKDKQNFTSSILLSDQIKRYEFICFIIIKTYTEFFKKHSRSMKLQKLQYSYLHFIIEVMHIPTKSFVEIISIRNLLRTKNASFKEQYIIESLMRLASSEFSAFWDKSEIQNQRLDMMSVIEFSDLNMLIAKNLKLLLYLKKDLLQFLNSDFVDLSNLLIKGQSYVQQRDLLEKQISQMFDINPQSRQSYLYAEIYCESFDTKQRRVSHFIKNSKLKLLKQLKKEDLGINIFRQKSCMVYITLLNPLGYIKRVSNTFEQLFGIKAEDAVGKSCNFMMPDVIAGIHDDFLKFFVERGNLHNLKKGIIFGFGKRSNGFMFALHARTKLVIDKENDFGVAGYFEEVNPDYDYFLCEPEGGVLDITERIFAYCFYELWKLDKKKIENLDVCKLIPLLSCQIHKENKHMQPTHYQTLMCIPSTNEMMPFFRKQKKIDPINDLGILFNKFKQFNKFIFLEVTLRYEQIDTAIGASVKFVEIASFRRIKKESEIIENLNSLKQEITKILDICLAVQFKPTAQNKKVVVEAQPIEVVKQNKQDQWSQSSQGSPINQEQETEILKQIQSFNKLSNNFSNNNLQEIYEYPNEQQIGDFIKINNQPLLKSPRTEDNFNLENTQNFQMTQLIQSPKYDYTTERSQLREIITNRDQQNGYDFYYEDNFQSEQQLFSYSNRDQNCIINALKEYEKMNKVNQEFSNQIEIKNPEVDLKDKSNNDFKLQKDIGSQNQATNTEQNKLENQQRLQKDRDQIQISQFDEQNQQQNGQENSKNQQKFKKQDSDQKSQSSGQQQSNSLLKNRKQTNSTMISSQMNPFASSLDNKLVIQDNRGALEKNKTNINFEQMRKTQQQIYFSKSDIKKDSDSSTNEKSIREKNMNLLVSVKKIQDKNIGQVDQNNLLDDILNNSEKNSKQNKVFNCSSSVRSTSSELHSKKLAIIEEIMHKKPPKFADIFIKIGKISGLILLTMCIIQFVLQNQKINTLEENNNNQQSISAFSNSFLKIVINTELIRNIKGFNLKENQNQNFNIYQIQTESMFYLSSFKSSLSKYSTEKESTSGIDFFNSQKIKTTFIGEFSQFTDENNEFSLIQSLNFFTYYAFNFINLLEDIPQIQGPIYSNFVNWINNLIQFQYFSFTELDDSLNGLIKSLEILFIITCFISFFSIVIILPVNISVETKKEDLLKLMCTFPPEKMSLFIQQTEDSIIKANQNYLMRALDNKLGNTKFIKPVKVVQNNKQNGSSQLNYSNQNQNLKSKKKTISQTSNLKKINFSSILMTAFIFCLLILQPTSMFIVTKSYIRQVQDNYIILNTLNKDSLLMNQLLSSTIIETNYIRVMQDAQASQTLLSNTLPNLENFTNNLLLKTKEQNNQMYTIQDQIQNCKSLSSTDKRNFIQLLNSNLCSVLPIYIDKLDMILPNQNYVPCSSELYQQTLQQGVVITQTKLQSLLQNLLSALSISDYIQYQQAIYQFDNQNSINQMSQALQDLDLSINSITSSINQQSLNDISYIQALGIYLFCFQLILVITLYYFLWQRILAKIKISFFSIKYLLTLFTIDQLLENSYLSNYFQKTKKSTRNK